MTVIASIGPNLPHDLLRASGRYAGPLGVVAGRETPRADQWMESKFAPWARALLEDWAAGAFDAFEAVVFSRADDSVHRLYYYLCELRRLGQVAGPEPIVFDIAKIPRASSADRIAEQVRALATRLGVSDEALEAAIVEANAERAHVPSPAGSRACLLDGTPPPDRRLHAAIESAGFAAIGETLGDWWRSLGTPVEQASGDPAAAIARQLHADSRGPRSFADPAAALLDRVRAAKASAVVLWRIEEDEAQTWQLPAQRRALDAADIPALVLTRRDWAANDGAQAEIAAFLERLPA